MNGQLVYFPFPKIRLNLLASAGRDINNHQIFKYDVRNETKLPSPAKKKETKLPY
jgi:hypothetical protein